jgi:predicted nucleic acid-binding protein
VIVVDASAMLDALLRPRSHTARARLFAEGESLHAPHVIDLEVVQVLRRLANAGEIEPARARAALDDLADAPVHRYAHDILVQRIWELRHNLTAYDAAYIALAEELDAPILTRDRKLASAAGHRARIELL